MIKKVFLDSDIILDVAMSRVTIFPQHEPIRVTIIGPGFMI